MGHQAPGTGHQAKHFRFSSGITVQSGVSSEIAKNFVRNGSAPPPSMEEEMNWELHPEQLEDVKRKPTSSMSENAHISLPFLHPSFSVSSQIPCEEEEEEETEEESHSSSFP